MTGHKFWVRLCGGGGSCGKSKEITVVEGIEMSQGHGEPLVYDSSSEIGFSLTWSFYPESRLAICCRIICSLSRVLYFERKRKGGKPYMLSLL